MASLRYVLKRVFGEQTFFLGTEYQPSSDNLMELLLMIDAAKRARSLQHYGKVVIPLLRMGFVRIARITSYLLGLS